MLDLLSRDRCFVIAEAGTAHMGCVKRAYVLAYEAHKAGADSVKFQWFTPNVSKDTMFCWMEGDKKRVKRWRQSAMDLYKWRDVKRYCDKLGIMLLASCFEHETVKWLKELDIQATKVASRAAKTFPYWDGVSPYLVSDGMFKPGNFVKIPSAAQFYMMQCEANYPSTMPWNGKSFGFSDHSGEPFLAIYAIAHGLKLLEVHFKVDGIDAGPDDPVCLNTGELDIVCQARDCYAEGSSE